jgi:hypothetical protein
MTSLYSYFYIAFVILSFISFFISFNTTGYSHFTSLLIGGISLIIALTLIIIMLFTHIYNTSQGVSFFQIISNIFAISGPFLLMFAVIGFFIYLTIFFKDTIENGVFSNNSNDFNIFSNVFILLVLLQTIITYPQINKLESNGKLSNITYYFMYLIGLLCTICVFNIYNISTYFKTDG